MVKTPQTKVSGTRVANLVAERAGVSLMTVSRVFNGSPRVAEATRARVLEAAGEVGYVPSAAARSLRRGRSNLIGYLLESPAGIRGHFHSDTLAGLESVVAGAGHMISLVAPSQGRTLMQTIQQSIAARDCAAFVVRFDHFAEDELRELGSAGAPIVVASSAPAGVLRNAGVSAVCFDNGIGCRQAVRHLHALGHRRIAFLNGDAGWIDSVQREDGFREGMQEVGLAVDDSLVKYCEFGNAMETAARAVDQILASGGTAPTAIFCASDEIAASAMAALRRWGRRVPEDVSVIGFDDVHWCRFLSPALTTVRHDGYELGLRLGEVLAELLRDPQAPRRHVTIGTTLVVRDSARPARVGNHKEEVYR